MTIQRVSARPRRVQPIKLGCFTLTETGLEVQGSPAFEEYEDVGEFIRRAHQASGWWLADWLAYAETRADWRDRRDQVIDAGILSEKTLRNVKYIGAAVEKSRRRDDVDFATHAEVAGMEPAEQERWLEFASENRWTRAELRDKIYASKKTTILEGQAQLEGMYRFIYAAPPFRYNDSGATIDGSLGNAKRHYEGMSIEELCALPVQAHAAPVSTLAMYVPAPLVYENPGPRDVAEAWGFTYKAQYVWHKVLGMPGHYNRVVHENLFIFTRGGDLPDNPLELPDSVQVVRRGDEYSEKPEFIRSLLTKHWTIGPYLELFGRKRVEGWDVFGNDAGLWAEQVTA